MFLFQLYKWTNLHSGREAHGHREMGVDDQDLVEAVEDQEEEEEVEEDTAAAQVKYNSLVIV